MRILTEEQMAAASPAIYATRPSPRVSERYGFVPTYKVIEHMANQNWLPVEARQFRPKSRDPSLYATHMVVFQSSAELTVGEITPQVYFINNHTGLRRAEFVSGFLKLLCDNGLMISKGVGEYDASEIHRGFTYDNVIRALSIALDKIDKASRAIEQWKQIILTPFGKQDFAQKARAFRPAAGTNLLLTTRREEDIADDLWTVYNVVQENIVQGGVMQYGHLGRRTRRALSSVDSRQRVNQALWALAQKFAFQRWREKLT